MIFVTGDTHSDFTRFSAKRFSEKQSLTKDDVVIICGDFGGVWYVENNHEENYWLNWLDNQPFTTCFVDGNHENFDRLNQLPVSQHFNGSVHQIRSSIFHLMRGECYTIQGKKIFTFGGAYSHDISDGVLEKGDQRIKSWSKDYTKEFRVNHVSWWKEEVPNHEEKERGLKTLEDCNNKVDFIITHTPPSEVLRQCRLSLDDISNYLQGIADTVSYDRWFSGHIHIDEYFPACRVDVLYNKIMRIW